METWILEAEGLPQVHLPPSVPLLFSPPCSPVGILLTGGGECLELPDPVMELSFLTLLQW